MRVKKYYIKEMIKTVIFLRVNSFVKISEHKRYFGNFKKRTEIIPFGSLNRT